MNLSNNINNKKCAPKLILFNEKKLRKIPMVFEICRRLTLKVKFWHFLTPLYYTNSQTSISFFGYVDFQAKIFPILYPHLKTRQPVLPVLKIVFDSIRFYGLVFAAWIFAIFCSHFDLFTGFSSHHFGRNIGVGFSQPFGFALFPFICSIVKMFKA